MYKFMIAIINIWYNEILKLPCTTIDRMCSQSETFRYRTGCASVIEIQEIALYIGQQVKMI